MIRVGIVGSDGYAVGELYHLLIQHPDVKLELVYSPRRKGLRVSDIFNALHNQKSLTFTDEAEFGHLDLLFICLPSGRSEAFLKEHDLPAHLKIIDFSREHRHHHTSDDSSQGFVYGLPEAYRRDITRSTKVALPGSFAMAVELPLIPLAKHMLLNSELHVSSIAGKTESFARPHPDQGLSYDVLFDAFQVTQPFGHSHEHEIRETLRDLQKSFKQEISMIPLKGSFNRGLYTTIYMDSPFDLSMIRQLYESYFEDHSFVRLVDEYPDVRDTINTNAVTIHLSKHRGKLLITSAMDNLMKGAAGNAIHNMNLMCALVETTGLKIKASIF